MYFRLECCLHVHVPEAAIMGVDACRACVAVDVQGGRRDSPFGLGAHCQHRVASTSVPAFADE